jgi:hypothetical protein
MKSQIPNPKSQIILNNQIQITQKVWILACLREAASAKAGACDLGFK